MPRIFSRRVIGRQQQRRRQVKATKVVGKDAVSVHTQRTASLSSMLSTWTSASVRSERSETCGSEVEAMAAGFLNLDLSHSQSHYSASVDTTVHLQRAGDIEVCHPTHIHNENSSSMCNNFAHEKHTDANQEDSWGYFVDVPDDVVDHRTISEAFLRDYNASQQSG